jgi:hypothetical protein
MRAAAFLHSSGQELARTTCATEVAIRSAFRLLVAGALSEGWRDRCEDGLGLRAVPSVSWSGCSTSLPVLWWMTDGMER